MADIRTIKIFLASSEELADERIRFGDFIRTLDDTYEQRGFRIKLIKWEDLPKGYDGRPTQETYNEYVRQCDLFVSLFYTKAGEFTLKEYNVAKQTQCELGKPTIYVFLRVLDKGEKEDKTLTDFKQNVLGTVKHYWTNYESSDTLQLKFVMDLLKIENKRLEDLKVENGIVNWGNIPVARMDNLSFASGNKDYQRMSQRLQELPEEIADARQLSDDHPEVGRYRDKLQKLLDEQNALKKELADQQTLLLDTAIRIAQLQGGVVTGRMRRAMDAFEEGNVREANIILDEAERDADKNLADYKRSKEITEQKRQNVLSSIDELLLKTTTIMADMSIAIEERICKTMDLYQQADHLADEVDLDKKEYSVLLFAYAKYLDVYGKYEKATAIYLRQIALSEELHGKDSANTSTSYNEIGHTYSALGDYTKSMEYYFKATGVIGNDYKVLSTSYNGIGNVYRKIGNYQKAIEYLHKALKMKEEYYGLNHPDTAVTYNDIGIVLKRLGRYPMAENYLLKAMEVEEATIGNEHRNTSSTYYNLGSLYEAQANRSMALEYYSKALRIEEKVLGKEHPNTAISYCNIGNVYLSQGNYDQAFEYYSKALRINEKVFGKESPRTATSYNNIGAVYYSQGDYVKALEYYFKALKIRENVLGKEHPNTATSYNNIGGVYYRKCCYAKALEYYFKALEIRETVLGKEHPDTIKSYNNVAVVRRIQDNNRQPLDYYIEALHIRDN